jgi:ABC-type sugar transport system ATPase subunit
MSVAENVAFSPRARGQGKQAARSAASYWLDRLRLTDLADRKPGQLSGGQAQRVALGRALVREPQVFLMDEPLSNLDAKLRTQTRGEIRRVQQNVRTTTVYVTHDQVEAMTMGDRIAVMNHGLLEQVGTPEELYERPANRFVAGFIGSPAMSFFDASNGRAAGFDVALPAPPGANGAAVTVGVRPEHVRRWNGRPDLIGPISGSVAFVEALGRETFLGVDAGGARLVVFEEGRSSAVPGDSIEFGLVASGLRYFAADTGRAI